ncbi:MAG TPA: ATP-binding protein [Polyangiaceae bacterium]
MDVPIEQLAATVLRALPSAVLVADEGGRVLFVNARAAEVLGKPGDELVGINVNELFGDHEPRPDTARLTTKVRHPNGEVITLGYTVSNVTTPGGRALRAISFRDVSDTVRLTQERDRLLQLAAVGEAMPTLLHELRNPLSAVLATVELLIEESPEGSVRDSLHAILTEARRIALQLDGAGAVGRSLRSRTSAAIDFACRDICVMMEGHAERADVNLRSDIPDLPLLPLDPATTRAVLFNLVTNALHACPPNGTVCVHLRLVRDGSELEVSVIDNGAGMSADVYARCTDLFFTTKRHGSGIGLALCRRAVESAGGRMEIQSVPGVGTAVVLAIPVSRTAQGGSDAPSPPPRPSHSSLPRSSRSSKRRRRHGLEK